MKWKRICELGCALPEVVEGIWFRTPALKVRGKSFVRLKEDGELVAQLAEAPPPRTTKARTARPKPARPTPARPKPARPKPARSKPAVTARRRP